MHSHAFVYYALIMAHPFTKQFEKALSKSTLEENLVLKEAQKILAKGYREAEVFGVLEKLMSGRIDDAEVEIIADALEELRGDDD